MEISTATIKTLAKTHGFDLVGITDNLDFSESRSLAIEHINKKNMVGLDWYTSSRVVRGTSPAELLPEVKSIISLGVNYYKNSHHNKSMSGSVALYAQDKDYHRVLKKMMRNLVLDINDNINTDIIAKWYVDDGPMLDKSVAFKSGIGWYGKNSNILTKSYGSWVLLGQILTNLELKPDIPIKTNCGTCTLCIDHCPTNAIIEPYIVKNSLCISYLTIEHKGPIPIEMRKDMGNWIFGCDVCQEVCPVNKFAKPATATGLKLSTFSNLDLSEILLMDESSFKIKFAGTPIMRTKLSGLKRNTCIVIGNRRLFSCIPSLEKSIRDKDPVVRSHSAWALGQFESRLTNNILKSALNKEDEDSVKNEIRLAISK
jgi:epoxyqueuosine reductase